MKGYLKLTALVLCLALLAGGAMALNAFKLLGLQPAAGEEPARHARPPIDAAQPQAFATATFAFG